MAKSIEKSFTTNIKVSVDYQLPDGIIADYNISNLNLKFSDDLNFLMFDVQTYFIEESTGKAFCSYGFDYPTSATFTGKSKKILLDLKDRRLTLNKKTPSSYQTNDHQTDLFKMLNRQGKMLITITVN